MSIINTIRSHRNVGTDERWLSTGAGAAVLVLNGQRPAGQRSHWLGLLGGTLVARGLSGYSIVYQLLDVDSRRVAAGLERTLLHPAAAHIHAAIGISRPVAEVYEFCCNLSNLPLVMRSVQKTERLPDGFQRLSFRLPQGPRFVCDLELTDDRENSNLISWRTRSHSGWQVQGFLSLKRGRGVDDSEAHVSLSYEPPLGVLGNIVARALSPFADDFVRATLGRLKTLLETKSAVTADAPTGPATSPPGGATRSTEAAPPTTAAGVDAETKTRTDEAFEARFRQTLDSNGRLLH